MEMLLHEVQARVPSPGKTHATGQGSRSGKMLTLVMSVPATHCHKEPLREQPSPGRVYVWSARLLALYSPILVFLSYSIQL